MRASGPRDLVTRKNPKKQVAIHLVYPIELIPKRALKRFLHVAGLEGVNGQQRVQAAVGFTGYQHLMEVVVHVYTAVCIAKLTTAGQKYLLPVYHASGHHAGG
jgi:hypothetical protein